MGALSKKLAELPNTWERPAILSAPAQVRFLSAVHAAQEKLNWHPDLVPPEFQDDPFHHAFLYTSRWAMETFNHLKNEFMQLLEAEHPRVDNWSIDQTIRQIKKLVGFIAFVATDSLTLAPVRSLPGISPNEVCPKRACDQIISDLKMNLVLWTDDFLAWAVPRRSAHESPAPGIIVSAITPSVPESNLQENAVPVAATVSYTDERPAWERLLLKESKSGDNSAFLNGESYRVGEPAFKMLAKLKQMKGERVKCKELQGEIGMRPSDIYKDLPEPLKAIVDMPGKKGRGAFMR